MHFRENRPVSNLIAMLACFKEMSLLRYIQLASHASCSLCSDISLCGPGLFGRT